MLAFFATLALIPFAPTALGLQPTARWGHQAVYVPSEKAMYIIGGQVQTPGTQITNEVLVLPLNGTNPSYTSGANANLPPHAFAGATLSHDGKSIVIVGGLSSDCAADSIGHVYSTDSASWSDVNIDKLVRRRGAALATFHDGGDGKMLLMGGIADTVNVYPAADVLSSPLSTSSVLSTSSFPSDLTGSSLAVADSAVTVSPDHKTIYMVGGQTASGGLAPMDTLGMWSPSGGWKSQKLGGTAPVGRIGATLVAHPSLDLLILHGGARDDRGSDLSTTLLAFINTTTWEWSIPSHLQPPQVSAASYHSAIMTPEGVMISAFGLNAAGSPRADTYFLDMRDPTQDGWTWKGQWNADMLGLLADSTTAASGETKPKRNLASIIAPILVVLVALPLAVWLIRRQVRINRHRRQARHFSFSSQEDEGEFKRSRFPWIRRGSDEKGWMGAKELYRRFTHKEESRGEKNWEEIDFGLGRVDERRGSRVRESRESSFSATNSPPARFTDQPSPLGIAMANGVTYTPPTYEPTDLPYANPFADTEHVIPSLTVQPPTAHPTPFAEPTEAFPVPQPLRPVGAASDDAAALDWSALEQSLTERPAFRSISPTSTLRSHQPGHQSPQRRASTDRPSLPPLDFGPRRSVSTSRPQSMIVNATPRSVSSPVSGRQIAGSLRRHSADVSNDSPAPSLASPVSSGYGSPQITTAVRFDARTGGPEYGSVSRNRPMSALRIANPSESDSDEQ